MLETFGNCSPTVLNELVTARLDAEFNHTVKAEDRACLEHAAENSQRSDAMNEVQEHPRGDRRCGQVRSLRRLESNQRDTKATEACLEHATQDGSCLLQRC